MAEYLGNYDIDINVRASASECDEQKKKFIMQNYKDHRTLTFTSVCQVVGANKEKVGLNR